MEIEAFFASKENKFLFLDRSILHLGIGIKEFVPIEKMDENISVAFVINHFFKVKSDMWKNFIPGGYIPKKYDYIPREEIVLKKSSQEYSCEKIYCDKEDYRYSFEKVIREIENNKCEKIVLSRFVECKIYPEIDMSTLFYRAVENNPNCYIFFYFLNGECFFGASPELLVEKQSDKVEVDALAGTLPNFCENKLKLMTCEKNMKEHQIVVNEIVKQLTPMCQSIVVSETGILELKNLLHLQTKIFANSSFTLLDFVKLLHPTPALGGKPKSSALQVIESVETYSRGCYGAPIGFVSKNKGCFAVGIRSALLTFNSLIGFAGGGIVKGSLWEEEYYESENKLKTIFELLKPSIKK